jgi:hypothetical protein
MQAGRQAGRQAGSGFDFHWGILVKLKNMILAYTTWIFP